MRPALVPIILADPLPWAKRAEYAWDFLRDRARFAGGYKGALANTPNWTFTRASTGYAQTSGGVLQSFASGELRRTDKGVLIEGAGTNLCLQSQTFDNASWANNVNVTLTAAAATAPDGTTTAYSMAGSSSASNTKRIGQNHGSAAAHTYSIYAKANTHSFIQFYIADNATQYANFNLATGAVGTTGAGATATVSALANGWYRCTMTVTLPGTSSPFVQLVPASTSAWAAASTTTSDVYLWGAQLEAAAFPSSYIPTTTASATRAADSLTVTGVTGLAYPLTIYCECELSSDAAGNQPAIWIDNGSGNTDLANLAAQMSTKKLRSTITASSAAQADISSTASSLAVGSVFKGALRVATNDAQQGLNGALATADTSVTLPSSPTILRFGINNTPGYLYGYIRRLAIFSRALSDGELQALTAA